LAGHQAGIRLRVRAAWLMPAIRRPAEVARGEEPASGFRELPARYGGDSAAAVTRRALLVGGRSLAPDSFVVGIEAGRDVMLPGTGLVRPIQRFQSGVVNDYVTWIVVGLACLGGALAFAIR
jgi:hypothetical protein